jgi:hypothetical protein
LNYHVTVHTLDARRDYGNSIQQPALQRRASIGSLKESAAFGLPQERICDQCFGGTVSSQPAPPPDARHCWVLDVDCDLILCFTCAQAHAHEGHEYAVLELPPSILSSLFRIANHDKAVPFGSSLMHLIDTVCLQLPSPHAATPTAAAVESAPNIHADLGELWKDPSKATVFGIAWSFALSAVDHEQAAWELQTPSQHERTAARKLASAIATGMLAQQCTQCDCVYKRKCMCV